MAQLNAFRNKVGNQNATLGQYMNAQKGLTARKGGANDPSVIQSKLGADKTAYNPSASKPDSMTPAQYAKEREMAKQNMAPKVPKPDNKPDASSEFQGRMIPPNESGVGANPPSPTFIGSKKDMRSGGPMGQMTSKDFAKNPPSSMNEEVTVGTNKYRIV